MNGIPQLFAHPRCGPVYGPDAPIFVVTGNTLVPQIQAPAGIVCENIITYRRLNSPQSSLSRRLWILTGRSYTARFLAYLLFPASLSPGQLEIEMPC